VRGDNVRHRFAWASLASNWCFVRYHTYPPNSIEILFSTMKDKERWLELCQQAAVEQDPKKLMALVTEINRLLQEKEQRLNSRTGVHPQRSADEKYGS